MAFLFFSSGSNLLSFAKLEIFDLICQGGKKKENQLGKIGLFSKSRGACIKIKGSEQIISEDDSWSHSSVSCKKIIFIISDVSRFPALLASISLSFTPSTLPALFSLQFFTAVNPCLLNKLEERDESHLEQLQISIKISGIQNPIR